MRGIRLPGPSWRIWDKENRKPSGMGQYPSRKSDPIYRLKPLLIRFSEAWLLQLVSQHSLTQPQQGCSSELVGAHAEQSLHIILLID